MSSHVAGDGELLVSALAGVLGIRRSGCCRGLLLRSKMVRALHGQTQEIDTAQGNARHSTNSTKIFEDATRIAPIPPPPLPGDLDLGTLEVLLMNATMDTTRILHAPGWNSTDMPLTCSFGYRTYGRKDPSKWSCPLNMLLPSNCHACSLAMLGKALQ